jgi:hypothetical protein
MPGRAAYFYLLSEKSGLDTKGLKNVLLYGSVTRDDAGRFYVGGWTSRDGGEKPLVLQITPVP